MPESNLETVAAMFGMGGTRVEVPDLAFGLSETTGEEGSSGATKSARFFAMIGSTRQRSFPEQVILPLLQSALFNPEEGEFWPNFADDPLADLDLHLAQ